MMDMSMGMDLLAQQQMRASPALIALNSMLVLSNMELHQMVQHELEANPALDLKETDLQVCPTCRRPMSGVVCFVCLNDDERLREAFRSEIRRGEAEKFDPLMTIAAPMSFTERLERDMRITLPEEDHPIISYIVGSLDPQGYLDCTVEEAAKTLHASVADVERVLHKLHELGPAGVGARNVQECLMLQLNQLEQEQTIPSYIRTIVQKHWNDLGEHRYTEIARVLGISYQDVVSAREFIRDNLRPFPLESLRDDTDPKPVLVPDVILNEVNGKFVVEVLESQQYSLRLNPSYQTIVQDNDGLQDLSDQDKDHIRTYMTRARLFLTNLRQRRDTIQRIATYLTERQEGYLRNGIRHLEPLTRAEVATALGLHESTISRATANKYVQLPNRELVPFSHFFQASLSVKDVIQEIIAKETIPLTDDQIVDLLVERGITIARRTVAKYRNQLSILPSHLR